jgi:cell division protein FtsW
MLATLTLCLISFGVLMVYSSSFILATERFGDGFWFLKRQALFALLGIMSLFLTSLIPISFWKKAAPFFWLISCLLLGLVLFPTIGTKIGGARRWIRFYTWGLQPAEVAKFSSILILAQRFSATRHFQTFIRTLVSHFVWIVPIVGLLLLQPDFGTSAIICLSLFCLSFLAAVPWRYLAITCAGLAAMAYGLITAAPYRLARLLAFLDPWQDQSGTGFQVIQSFLGFYNGGFWGQGLGNSKEKLFFLPEAHNDFICSVIAEEHGFLGIFILVGVWSLIILRGFKTALSQLSRQDLFGYLLASGLTLNLGLPFLLNLCVVLGLVPTKGLASPFLSYGGSALVMDCASVGVLLSLSKMQNPKGAQP